MSWNSVRADRGKENASGSQGANPIAGVLNCELIMSQKNPFENVGYLVSTDICGISVAGNKAEIGPDSTVSRIAINHCGGNVFEVWFHTPVDVSVRVIVTSEWMKDVEKALRRMRKALGSGTFEV